jgi:phosphoenolpyruvate-protein kinase (PTS system EI component)
MAATIIAVIGCAIAVVSAATGITSRATADAASARADQLEHAWQASREELGQTERRCAADIGRLEAEIALLREGVLADIAAEIGERVVAAIAPEMRTLIASRQVGGRRTTDPKEGTP